MKIIGHRGARGLAPENTIASFDKALEHNVDAIEFDVRVTKDGIPVIHHNRAINVNGQKFKIRDYTLDKLLEVRPDLPTFSAVLRHLAGKVPLEIEVKSGESTEPIIKIIRNHLIEGTYDTSTLFLGSKSQKTLRQLHRSLPEIEKVVIEPFSGVRARLRANHVNSKRIRMRSWWLWSGFIKAVHRSGYRLEAYTMNDPKKVRKWERYGLYGVITDFPDRFERS